MPQVKGLKELKVAGQATNSRAFDFFVQWHLTERCNLHCSHCYQSGPKTGRELTLAEVREVLDEVSEMLYDWAETYKMDFSPGFNITGGEPFLRTDILDIVSGIRARGFDVYLLTNGTLINGQRAKALASLGVKGVQVSIEGPEEIHDNIRGDGSFARSMGGIRTLLDSGLKVTMNATLSALNAGYMMDIVETASALGVQRVGFSRLVPSGRGESLINEMLKKDEIRALYQSLLGLEIDGLEIVTGDPVASQMGCSPSQEDADDAVALGGCAAGVSGLTFMPDGTILPCRRLNIPIGNIKKDSIREVWATSKALSKLRDKSGYKGKCGDCPRWHACRGCRAIAYAYSRARGNGDMLSEDPQCFI